MIVVEKGPGSSAALFTPIRLDPAISQSGMELWVQACGWSPGIGEKGARMGVGGQGPILAHSWVILSDLDCSSLQSRSQSDGGAGKVGAGTVPPGSLDLRLLLVLLGKSPWFPGSDLITAAWQFCHCWPEGCSEQGLPDTQHCH